MNLLVDGLQLMLLGMGMVFSFLIIMIFLVKLMSKVLAPYAHYFEPAPAAPKRAAGGNDTDAVAAAVAAVELFRNK